MHPALLLVLYLALICAPLGLAFAQDKPPRPLLDELSSGAALAGFAILLAEFVLSGRFRAISGRIGMDVTMRLHQLLARTALVLIVLHPFLYSTPDNPPIPGDTTRQLTLGLDGASVLTGIVALVLLPVLAVTAIFRDQLRCKYETWRLAHGLGALLVALFGAHHALAAGRYSAEPLLSWFWIVLLALAIASLVWVYACKPLAQWFRPYAVKTVRRIAERTWELVIEPKGHAGMPFAAGQFVWLNVGHSPFSLYENPFSMSSAPGGGDIAFVIKEAGDFTGSLGQIRSGTTAYVDGPHGNLTLDRRHGKGIALLAGGVGIAPLISLLRELARSGDPRPIVLVYGNRAADQIVYRDELDALAKRENVSVVHVLSEPPPGWTGLVGQLDAERIRAQFAFPDAREWIYFVCGPPAMLEACERALIALGVPPAQIVSERFRYD